MVGRIYEQDEVLKIILEAAKLFCKHNHSTTFYFTDERTALKMKDNSAQYDWLTFSTEKHEDLIDYIVTFGGDGTILYGAKFFTGKTPPVVSFMRGTLGFLCRFHHENMDEVIVPLVQHHQKQIDMPFKTASIMRLETTKVTRGRLPVHK